MNTISTAGHISPDVSRSLFKAIDRNGDQQLSIDEFASFLNRLAGTLAGGQSTGGLGSAATAIAASAATAPPARPAAPPAHAAAAGDGYAPIPGFDLGKLMNSTHENPKYSPAVRVFSQAICAGNLQPGAAGLQSIVAYAQARGFGDAKVVGDDRIDFGDGVGPVDVITSAQSGVNMGWWFNNQPAVGS